MKAQHREAAAPNAARLEVRLGMGAVDGAAAPPEAAGRFGGVVGAARVGGRHRRTGKEGARLVERRAKRRRVDAMADDVEQVAMFARRRIGELPGCARRHEADVEGSPAPAVEVARDPVSAPAAAVGQVAPAHLFGSFSERCRDGGGWAHDAHFGREREPAKPEP